MWNVYDAGEIRTNNNIEGWHRDCKETFGKHRLLWIFLSKLHVTQKMEEAWYTKVRNGNRRAVADKRKRKYQQKEESLLQLKGDYDRGHFLSKVDYIKAVARYQGAAHGEEDVREEDLALFEGEEVAVIVDELNNDEDYDIEGPEESD